MIKRDKGVEMKDQRSKKRFQGENINPQRKIGISGLLNRLDQMNPLHVNATYP